MRAGRATVLVRLTGMEPLRKLIKGIREPRRGFLEVRKRYHRDLRGRTGVDVVRRDWDNLVILDACRFDLFEEMNTLDGRLSREISKGSNTAEFFARNFDDRKFPDIVYVSANPQFELRDMSQHFYEHVPLWEQQWDDNLKTVRPASVTSEALETESQYPDKRLIVHYLQPHFPFIGETGRQIEQRSVTGGGVITEDPGLKSVWERLEDGEIDASVVWDAYRENLELALPHVEDLVRNLTGKTVVTSDHGNAFGDWGIYGHPRGFYLDSLVEVPWLDVPFTERRDVESGDSASSESRTPDTDVDVEQRLRHLGYVDET